MLLVQLAAASFALFHLASASANPSNVPTCTVICPPEDQLGFPVGPPPTYDNDAGGVHFCSYPAVPNEDPNDFFCTYSDTDGHLITDNDAGLCQPSAQQNCIRRKGRRNLVKLVQGRHAKPPTPGPVARSFKNPEEAIAAKRELAKQYEARQVDQ